MIDGRDVLGEVWDGIGRDPDDLLGPSSPLIPHDEGHDVILGVNTCGVVKCESVAARVRRDGADVVWDRFHWVHGPHLETLGPFRFSVEEYLYELERAHRERDWESSDRRTARLVRDGLLSSGRLTSIGWAFGWAAATNTADWYGGDYAAGVGVYLVSDGGGVVLGFPTAPGEPAEGASRICETVFTGDSAEWPVVCRH